MGFSVEMAATLPRFRRNPEEGAGITPKQNKQHILKERENQRRNDIIHRRREKRSNHDAIRRQNAAHLEENKKRRSEHTIRFTRQGAFQPLLTSGGRPYSIGAHVWRPAGGNKVVNVEPMAGKLHSPLPRNKWPGISSNEAHRKKG